MTTNLSIFGIRHHGPGSARALVTELETLQPDCLLVEGPSDADSLIPWLDHELLAPPVALIMVRTDAPNRAGIFPFARFSPEYQAIRYGLRTGIETAFMDLPQATILAREEKFVPPDADALQELARLAGFESVEPWWNMMVEQRQNRQGIFAAVQELMLAAREASAESPPPDGSPGLNDQREAFMRTRIRRALAQGRQRIAVVCGAYHGPALALLNQANPALEAADAALLADLPAADVEGAWAPWTYGRLALSSGYGSGIQSPGWYDHLWEQSGRTADPGESSIIWLSRIAALLRSEGMDASSAHVIEAARLADSLAALRGLPLAGLPELNEATRAVLCFGRDEPLDLIRRKLIVGERMGAVPPDAPMTPLQRDLYRLQQELSLYPEPEQTPLQLDLREERDQARSRLLHRLNLLNIPWGRHIQMRNQMGTFRENWQLQWQPDLAVRVMEAGLWGNSVADAAVGYVAHRSREATHLDDLTKLLDAVMLADLPESVADIVGRIEELAAQRSDILHMMAALPPLARILRYGSVRRMDHRVLRHVVDRLLTRICLGLPGVCASLNDEAAQEVESHITQVHGVVNTLQNPEHRAAWHATLASLLETATIHGLIGGRACRLLFDARVLDADAALRHLERNLSISRYADADLGQAARWLDGFLKGDGLLLIHDQALWALLDQWVITLDEEEFLTIAPLLRRTFSGFHEHVRQQLDERIRHSRPGPSQAALIRSDFDHAAAVQALPFLTRITNASRINTNGITP
ncbi:MAG: hypothetical protein KDD92_20670 [Caldilineaceae bacterium]|nr:hypothetical protein [Caldilineaceae bacterium]